MVIELPIVFAENYAEIERAKESGIEISPQETIDMVTFIVPGDCLIRLNASSKRNRTSLYFDGDSYEVDANYETVLEILKRAIKTISRGINGE